MARPKPNPALMRNNILIKAQSIIQKRGFEGLTMKVLATELGISVGKIYTFFAGKDAIFLELEIQFFEEIITSIESIQSEELSARERLHFTVKYYYEYASRHLDLYKLVTSPPKVFSHYIGSDHEALAKKELDAALKSINLLKDALTLALPKEIKGNSTLTQQRYLFLVNAIHGLILNSHSPIFPYISADNATLINNSYQQPNKDDVIEQQVNAIIQAVTQ